jgi:two-component system, NtrC family, sensor kinase
LLLLFCHPTHEIRSFPSVPLKEVKYISGLIRENQQKINHHGKRVDDIVRSMLLHSQSGGGKMEPTDLNAVVDEYFRLSIHGFRRKEKTMDVDLITNYDESIGNVNLVQQDIGRVLLNLFNNALYAVMERRKNGAERYQPIISVTTKKYKDKIEISVNDIGNGIPQKVKDNIFQPFFTTKPTGQGTGLGLSMSYDIIKAQGGEIRVETKEGESTEFLVLLPISG